MKTIISITALVATLFSFNAKAGMGHGTAIQVSAGITKSIESIMQGDEIQTVQEGSTIENIITKQVPIAFSAGTGSTGQFTAAFVSYGNDQQLIVTADQTFLTVTGNLIRANLLIPGRDQLVDASGRAVNIKTISMGIARIGLSNIAPASNQVTENLLLANGVFLGSLKINQSTGSEAFKGQVLNF